jgi:hypothetical protein
VLPNNLPDVKSILIPKPSDERDRGARNNHQNAITAKVFLSDPTFLDGFQTLNSSNKMIKDQAVSLTMCPSPTEAVLCVAHLPFGMAEESFQHLVGQFGAVKWAFLMRSTKTGIVRFIEPQKEAQTLLLYPLILLIVFFSSCNDSLFILYQT